MRRYILRRLLIAIPILLGVSIVTFTFANLAPGDPVSALIKPGSDVKPADLEQLKAALGLNQPFPERYVTWLGQLLQGNFGASFVSGQSVAQTLGQRIPNTIKLMGTALFVSLFLGIALGILSAFRKGTKLDTILTTIVFAGISLPSYLIALLAVVAFAIIPYSITGIKFLPATGMVDPASTAPPILDQLWHLILPASVLAFGGTATFLRYTRASVLEVMSQDHVTTARSKGLPDRDVQIRHILRNALLPVITVLGLSLPSLITGALFVETLFTWPGVGSLAIESTQLRDYPMIMGIALVTSVAIIASNLVTDIAYAFVDPPDSIFVSADADRGALGEGALGAGTASGLPGLAEQRSSVEIDPVGMLPEYLVWEPSAQPEFGHASPWQLAARRFRRNRLAMTGLVILICMTVVAVLASVIAPYDPIVPDLHAFGVPPNPAHLLGTDASGRDVLTRLMYGARVSLSVGLVAVSIYLTIGTILGAIAGYRRGLTESVIMRITDTVMSFPSLIIILAVIPVLGPSIFNIMLVIGLLGWPSVTRLVRGEFLSLREREFTLAARGIGARDRRIIFRHILPNVAGPLVVLASFGVADAIITEAGLSLLGLGVQPPDPSWGNMLSSAVDLGTVLDKPWLWVFPGAAIAITVLSINFIGDGLRDALDPRGGRGRR